MAARIHAATPIKDGGIWSFDQEFGKAVYAHFIQLGKITKSDVLKTKIINLQNEALSTEFFLKDVK